MFLPTLPRHLIIGIRWNPQDKRPDLDLEPSLIGLDINERTPHQDYWVHEDHPIGGNQGIFMSTVYSRGAGLPKEKVLLSMRNFDSLFRIHTEKVSQEITNLRLWLSSYHQEQTFDGMDAPTLAFWDEDTLEQVGELDFEANPGGIIDANKIY